MFINSTSLIIPTKDRFEFIKKLFKTLGSNINYFDEILIVDSSSENIHKKIINKTKTHKNIRVIKSDPSTSIQRNIGIKEYNKRNKFIMFCDDDIIFSENSINVMDQYIKNFPDYIGYGFNLIEKNHSIFLDTLKKKKIFTQNGIYNSQAGKVAQSGWHTKISNINKNIETTWLSTQACVYRSNFIKEKIYFDISLGIYSYLEDLFFSFELSKQGKLTVCANATYTHPNEIIRSNFKFGVKEMTNRFKFVKKNKLSIKKFYIAAFLKCILNLNRIFSIRSNSITKFFGNIIGIILCIINQKK
ncbi:MAG: hypothetical protein CMI79_00810 [Candidatus Pelagibacter sp.]|nr:hypothetical protein [Candidatus Pelagibacter sp.]|tara:strand:+ start:28 stop:933 length:906 start_codon:yes stop_codon:yes gene_type:complete